MADGQWHHFGARVTTTQVQVLIDGVVKETSSHAEWAAPMGGL